MKRFTIRQAQALVPRRKKTANKSGSGRTLVIAGSAGMLGAGVLTAIAASRVGAGYTTLLANSSTRLAFENPDFLTCNTSQVGAEIARSTAVACGPGLGRGPQSLAILRCTLRCEPENLVLDADALFLLAQKPKQFRLHPNWILTPHEGEMARLLGCTAQKVAKSRAESVRAAVKKFACIVLLKGAGTLIGDGRQMVEIGSGNRALAKAGTGDVLTGIITGFLSQRLVAFDAACLGAFVHGFVADRWIQARNDVLSLMPTDILADLPKALGAVRNFKPRTK